MIEFSVGLNLLCMLYHPSKIWMNEAVHDSAWILCLLTWIAMQHCDQSGAIQRDLTGVLGWVLTNDCNVGIYLELEI